MKITEKAASKVKEIMEAHGGGFAGILITFEGGYKLDLVKEEDAANFIKIDSPVLGVYSTAEFLSRAEAAGYQALVLTTDVAVLGRRERDLRTGFVLPTELRLANFDLEQSEGLHGAEYDSANAKIPDLADDIALRVPRPAFKLPSPPATE